MVTDFFLHKHLLIKTGMSAELAYCQAYSNCPKECYSAWLKLWRPASKAWASSWEKKSAETESVRSRLMWFSSLWDQSSFELHDLHLKDADSLLSIDCINCWKIFDSGYCHFCNNQILLPNIVAAIDAESSCKAYLCCWTSWTFYPTNLLTSLVQVCKRIEYKHSFFPKCVLYHFQFLGWHYDMIFHLTLGINK